MGGKGREEEINEERDEWRTEEVWEESRFMKETKRESLLRECGVRYAYWSIKTEVCMQVHALTHSFIHSDINTRTHSVRPLIHLFTQKQTHALTRSSTYSDTSTRIHSFIYPPSYPLATYLLIHLRTINSSTYHSLIHLPFTHPFTIHSSTYSPLTHPLTNSLSLPFFLKHVHLLS